VFRLVDHTADLAISVRANTQEQSLADAALGIAAVLTGRHEAAALHQLGPPEREIHFVLEAPDEPSLAVAVLSELLWLHESEDVLWLGGGMTISTTNRGMLRVEATGNGVHHDLARHGRGVEVKAVTYHGLRWQRVGKEWELWVLLDI
jgi:SHS2 domain-containing protein